MTRIRINRTGRLAASLIALAIFCAVPVLASEEWNVQYGWIGGYGRDEGILITSDGRVGLVTDQLFDKFDECPMDRLDAEEVAKIQGFIDQIPKAIPNNSHTRILDSCHDEPEHFVVVSFGNEKQAFQYTKRKQCLSEGDPPDWLAALVEHLESQYSELSDCKTIPSDEN